MKTIQDNFPISEKEYSELNNKFGALCYYASWQLARKNTKNNHQCDIEDFQQNLVMAAMKAGSYFKRQVYIEKCLEVAKQYAKDEFMIVMLAELQDLWDNRTRHGANRQKFGRLQERLLNSVVRKIVPRSKRPDRKDKLLIDTKFATYCKQIIWNEQRSMGKKITREKPLRSGLVSISEFDFVGDSCGERF